MEKGIVFIGGIHGVGKGTLCKEVSEQTNFVHLTASEVLKWQELNQDSANKSVENVPYMQDRLVSGLKAIVKFGTNYLLDGHFSLITHNSVVELIPIETFKQIKPLQLIVVTDNPSEIKRRLEQRDRKDYDILLLTKLQEAEVSHAQKVSNILDIQLNVCNIEDRLTIYEILKPYQA